MKASQDDRHQDPPIEKLDQPEDFYELHPFFITDRGASSARSASAGSSSCQLSQNQAFPSSPRGARGTGHGPAVLSILFVLLYLCFLPHGQAGTNITLWDTSLPLPKGGIESEDRAAWKIVPNNLLELEKDPSKAKSDPGYYGREYEFLGDAVVENQHFTAVFWSAQDRLVLFAKQDKPAGSRTDPHSLRVGRKLAELSLASTSAQPQSLRRLELVRNGGDEVVLEAVFDGAGPTQTSVSYVFGKSEIVEIKPADPATPALRIRTSLAYGVSPSFVGDDLIVDPRAYPEARTLALPSENMFLGLAPGNDAMLVLTWPNLGVKQRATLELGGNGSEERLIESVLFHHGGQGFYLAPLQSAGIWHREALKPNYLEKDVVAGWQRPFPAKWKTLLDEAGVKTSFHFRDTKGTVWRGVPGSYAYPVWFEGNKAFFHLSKKVPPRGEALVYFLEGQDTPMSISTPVDILQASLGRPLSDPILDVTGRKLRTHHRRGGQGAHRSCTCGHTEVIQAYFELKEEVVKKEEIAEAIKDMIYFVQRHVDRIHEYRQFADDTTRFLRPHAESSPRLKPIFDRLEEIVRRIPEEYEVQKENMKSMEHARDLARQTMALTDRKDPKNLEAYMELLKAWRAMGGAQDYVLAQCHGIARTLYQEAGWQGLTEPDALPALEELRARCRNCLRHPDGYEIWADY